MAIDVAQYNVLKKKAADAKSEADRAEGALQAKMRQLKDEFGCDSISVAEALLVEKNKALEAAEAEYGQKLAEFQEKWGKLLEAR